MSGPTDGVSGSSRLNRFLVNATAPKVVEKTADSGTTSAPKESQFALNETQSNQVFADIEGILKNMNDGAMVGGVVLEELHDRIQDGTVSLHPSVAPKFDALIAMDAATGMTPKDFIEDKTLSFSGAK